ncbi:DJ-1/PfpI family protein [Streptomyces sp. NPDC000594]|uniref:DJ-1/PfpI family protein n=1 Tax=Streptomyces sp. NPDC000594 TaxID=3154261 RepID=UPI00331D5B3F
MLAQIVLFDGFDPLDALGPYEALFAGGLFTGGELTVELVTAEGEREVPSGAPPLSVRATGRLDPERADLIVVPGAAGRMAAADDSPLAARVDSIAHHLERALATELPALLKEAVARPDVTVATVCAGSAMLARLGLIEGRYATTHHTWDRTELSRLEESGVRAVDARVVDDGDLVTAAGVVSGVDLGIHLLERSYGPRIGRAVEKLLGHDRRGLVWRAEGLEPSVV